jgi:predicted phage terminase large subunit-like protein
MGATMEIRAQSGRQELFLSSPADIAIYGGSAGGGKTWSLLIDPLRNIDNKDFGATLFRRTYPEITNQGGMWDESEKLYPYARGKGTRGDLVWRFPSGARVEFAHCQNEDDKKNYDGAQICLLAFDQLEHFSESMWWYLGMRNRSTCGVRPRIRATCNPDPDSWLIKDAKEGWGKGFIGWWIGEDGYADLERAGKIRWFVRWQDKLYWADTPEELNARFAFVDPPLMPRSVTFIPATVWDNQILMKTDPAYLANLQSLPPIERERFLGDRLKGGNWKVRPTAGKVFDRAWFKLVDEAPKGGVECRFFDFAGAEKIIKGDDPDFTAGPKIRKVGGNYYVTDLIHDRYPAGEIHSMVKSIANQDRALAHQDDTRYLIRWEQEPNDAAIRDTLAMKKNLEGFNADGVLARGNKYVHWKPFATIAQSGHVYVLVRPWTENFLSQMHGIPDLAHDDVADGASKCYEQLEDLPETINRKTQPNPWTQVRSI